MVNQDTPSTAARTVPAEQDAREQELADRVVDSFAGASSPRLKELLQGLSRHLHAFVREVGLTEEEWHQAMELLAAAGRITDERRQEFILLSDVLGVSMQTITVADVAAGGVTESTVFGPFFVEGSPEVPLGGDISAGAEGRPCWVEGLVRDVHGAPVPGARIEVWEADANGLYDVQYGDDRVAARAHLFADEHGAYRFWAVTPTAYPIPSDGPVGRLLAAAGRSPMRPAHLHFMVSAPGRRTLVTHIFVEGDRHLDSDAVFGVRPSLVREFVDQGPGVPAPDRRDLGGAGWTRVRFDPVLAPERPGDTEAR